MVNEKAVCAHTHVLNYTIVRNMFINPNRPWHTFHIINVIKTNDHGLNTPRKTAPCHLRGQAVCFNNSRRWLLN